MNKQSADGDVNGDGNGKNGRVHGRKPHQRSGVDAAFKESMVAYLWRQREGQLGALAAVEDLLISLGEPVKRTKERRSRR